MWVLCHDRWMWFPSNSLFRYTSMPLSKTAKAKYRMMRV